MRGTGIFGSFWDWISGGSAASGKSAARGGTSDLDNVTQVNPSPSPSETPFIAETASPSTAAPTETPTPSETKEPETEAPTTPAPITAAPTTAAPTTPAPTTAAPTTPAPTWPAPTAAETEKPAPIPPEEAQRKVFDELDRRLETVQHEFHTRPRDLRTANPKGPQTGPPTKKELAAMFTADEDWASTLSEAGNLLWYYATVSGATEHMNPILKGILSQGLGSAAGYHAEHLKQYEEHFDQEDMGLLRTLYGAIQGIFSADYSSSAKTVKKPFNQQSKLEKLARAGKAGYFIYQLKNLNTLMGKEQVQRGIKDPVGYFHNVTRGRHWEKFQQTFDPDTAFVESIRDQLKREWSGEEESPEEHHRQQQEVIGWFNQALAQQRQDKILAAAEATRATEAKAEAAKKEREANAAEQKRVWEEEQARIRKEAEDIAERAHANNTHQTNIQQARLQDEAFAMEAQAELERLLQEEREGPTPTPTTPAPTTAAPTTPAPTAAQTKKELTIEEQRRQEGIKSWQEVKRYNQTQAREAKKRKLFHHKEPLDRAVRMVQQDPKRQRGSSKQRFKETELSKQKAYQKTELEIAYEDLASYEAELAAATQPEDIAGLTAHISKLRERLNAQNKIHTELSSSERAAGAKLDLAIYRRRIKSENDPLVKEAYRVHIETMKRWAEEPDQSPLEVWLQEGIIKRETERWVTMKQQYASMNEDEKRAYNNYYDAWSRTIQFMKRELADLA